MLVIFDCDGVLVDSELLSNTELSRVLGRHGLDLTVEQTIHEFMGRSRKTVLARVEELLGRPVPETFEREYEEARDAVFHHELRAVPGIEEAVDAIEAAGAATCVASSGDHRKMRLTLGLTGLYERFEGRIFSATEVERGKPAPDLFLHAAERMGFAPPECVVVEDSPAGVEAARAARMRVLGYAATTPPERLAAADEVFRDMARLPGLLPR